VSPPICCSTFIHDVIFSVRLIEAIILGLVQGLTEFLPVSSSAHLYIVPTLLGWKYSGVAFDVALHGGTLLAPARAAHRRDHPCRWIRSGQPF
jgi:hypothetical protein